MMQYSVQYFVLIFHINDIFKIKKPVFFYFDTIDLFFLINNSKIFHPRDRSQGALNRKQKKFETFTYKELSRFEKMKMDTNEIVNAIIKRIIQRADPTPDRGRRENKTRNKTRDRNSDRDRDRGRGRGRDRGRTEKITNETNKTNEASETDETGEADEAGEADENDDI